MTISVKHSFVSPIPDDPVAAAAGEVIPSNWNANHTLVGTVDSSQLTNTTVTPGSYTNTNLTVNAQGQITLAANGTAGSGLIPLPFGGDFYVATTGSDVTGDGSVGNPWATPQFAADTISSTYYVPTNTNFGLIFIHMDTGTYTTVGGLQLGQINNGGQTTYFQADNGKTVVLNTSNCNNGSGVFSAYSGRWGINASGTGTFTLDASTDANTGVPLVYAANKADITLLHATLGKAGSAGAAAHMKIHDGNVWVGNDLTITGTALALAWIKAEQFQMAGFEITHGALTLSVDPGWSQGTLLIERYGFCYWSPDSVSGTSSGKLYTMDGTSWLAAYNTIPGTTAGTTSGDGCWVQYGDVKQFPLGAIAGPAGTYANRPAAITEGRIFAFTDSSTATLGATITGGGSNHVLGYYDGTNWFVMAAFGSGGGGGSGTVTSIATSSPITGGTITTTGTIGLGNVPVTNLNSGTGATSTTFWRGDGTWATPSGGTATPGGSFNSIQYNNAGALGGFGAVSSSSLFLTDLSSNQAAYFDSNLGSINIGIASGNAGTASGVQNVTIGEFAGNTLTSGLRNILIGLFAGSGLTTSSNNVFIGTQAGNGGAGAGNVCLGQSAGNGSATEDVFIGHGSGFGTSAGFNLAIGGGAMGLNGGSSNVAIGNAAMGASAITGQNNLALGSNSLNSLTTGQNNVGIGQATGIRITTGGNNVLEGQGCGSFIVTGSHNVGMGSQALAGGDTQDNTGIGTSALNACTGSSNTAIGSQAGITQTSGDFNLVIGFGCDGIGSGSRNTILGTNLSLTGNPSDCLVLAKGLGSAGTSSIILDYNYTVASDITLKKSTGVVSGQDLYMSAVATNAAGGFIYVGAGAGTPTGTPAGRTGTVPMYIDTTNSQLWLYMGGSWKQPKTPAGAALVTWQ